MDKLQFWKNYRDGQNASKPSLYAAGSHPGAPVSADEVFSASLALVSSLSSSNAAMADIRFFAEGKRLVDPTAYLPQAEDGDFHGWNRRMKAQFQNYALIINHLERHLGEKVRPIRDFVTQMTESLGYPTRSADLSFFAGCYEKTPFGVHRDAEINFYWPLIGPKLMRFWAPEYGDEVWSNGSVEESKNYERHMERSQAIVAQPGDLIAWPGHWWHIGESREFNLSFTIPLCFHVMDMLDVQSQRNKLLDDLLQLSVLLAEERLVSNVSRRDTSIVVPHFITEASGLLSKIYPREELKEALMMRWVTIVSTAGLEYKMQIKKNKPMVSVKGIFRAPRLIRWTKLNRQKVGVVCDGVPILVRRTKGNIKILEMLNTLKPAKYMDLQKAFGGKKASKENLNKFLADLVQIGAVEIMSERVESVKGAA